MARPVLPETIVNGVTPGHNAHSVALAKQYNMGAPLAVVNALDPQHGLLGDGSDESAGLNALYDLAESEGLPLWLPKPPVSYGYATDLEWDSQAVPVLGAGAGLVTLQAIGDARIIAKPATLVAEDPGPVFRGFTVAADPAGPDDAIGIYSGDIVGAEFADILFRGFNGADSIGLQFDNEAFWTELNKLRRVRFDDCTVCIRCSVSGGDRSFARNDWDVHFNLHEGQIGFQPTDNALLYAQHGFFDGNAIGDDAVFIDMAGPETGGNVSAMSGHVDMEFETTGAFTGVVGVRELWVSFQFVCSGIRNYSESITPDRGGGVDLLSLPLGLRIREGTTNARQGAATLVAGSATVNTTAIKDASAGQRVDLTRQAGAFNSPRGHLEVGTRVDGVSFDINATDDMGFLVDDVSVVSWRIVDNWGS